MWSGTLGEACFRDRYVSAYFPILHRPVSGNTQSVDLTTTSHCILSLGRRAGAKSLDGPSGSQCEGTIARGLIGRTVVGGCEAQGEHGVCMSNPPRDQSYGSAVSCLWHFIFLSLSYGLPARITLFSQLAAILGTTFQIRRVVRGKSAVIFDFRE